jgi:tetratricopeptide (TPR) repeat protein
VLFYRRVGDHETWSSRPVRRISFTLVAVVACASVAVAAPGHEPPSIDRIERGVLADPENLKLGADYRQLAIASGDFDRPIGVLEKLAKRKGSGPNVQISLALAYVDKVPTSGDIRRLYLGRDAINALTRAIAQRPTMLAYYVRGLINLYYNNFIFHRVPRGVADLEQALLMGTDDSTPALNLRVRTALGDGYFRLGNAAKAREVWSAALTKFPADAGLKSRLEKQGTALEDIVTTALTASRRVDTSLADVFPQD